MTPPAQTLELVSVDIAPIARPSHNLIVADAAFLSTLKAVEATVASLKISDAQSAQQAADLQSRLTGAGKTLENTRVQLKAPFLALNKQIDAAAQPVQLRIDLAKRALSVAQTNWIQERRRLAEEQERARLAELRRLEAIRLAEEAAAKKKADEIAEQVRKENEARAKVVEAARVAGLPIEVPEEVWDEPIEPEPIQKTETEVAIERLKYAPVATVIKSVGVREVTTLVPFVTDVNKLPDCFVDKTPKLSAIRQTFCAGFRKGDALPVLDGCRFEVQTTTQSTGKGGF